MTRPNLGTKRLCAGCAVRFYDLSRMPPTCPKCGAVQPPDTSRPRPVVRNPPGGRRGAWPASPVTADLAEPVSDAVPDDTDDEAEAAEENADDGNDDDEAETEATEIGAGIAFPPGTDR